MKLQRFPSVPLITHDPYFSIWSPCDHLTDGDTAHWSGLPQRMQGMLTVDGQDFRFLGGGDAPAAAQTGLEVRATTTLAQLEASGVRLSLRFTSPLLPDDMDRLSMPITLVKAELTSIDDRAHEVHFSLRMLHDICSFRQSAQQIVGDAFALQPGLTAAWMGKRQQSPLNHCADLATIDWGYAFVAGPDAKFENNGEEASLLLRLHDEVTPAHPADALFLLAYDDVASINYMGVICRAWYARRGMRITDALTQTWRQADALLARCDAFDQQLQEQAEAVGGADYAMILAAAYRHTIAAHKLIADDEGEMAFLSKENDSNGCTATVDISYPSSPLFLLYCPQLVKAFLRPILRYAVSPSWPYAFAPHDIGRYPYATGQAYGLGLQRANVYKGNHHGCRANEMETYPPFYLYPPTEEIFDLEFQMPLEECGNMLILTAAYVRASGDTHLARAYHDLLRQWADYLAEHGRDPGHELTTDDFAGHSSRNMNLAAKALIGVRCYADLAQRCGWTEEIERCMASARDMAAFWKHHLRPGEASPLTFDGDGWSMKYNMVWDLVFGFDLWEKEVYRCETRSYLSHAHLYGCPLDSRAEYTKSDWLAWCAAMAEDKETMIALLAPMARYLHETPSRVPFSDWYDTKTGVYQRFIARSVQGGLFMPLLRREWTKQQSSIEAI